MLFIKEKKGDESLLVGVYVDDLIVSGTSVTSINHFKEQMKIMLSMSDLGLPSYYLGTEVNQSDVGISLCQYGHAAKLLEKSGMAKCNSAQTPMEARLHLSKDSKSPPIDSTQYRSIVGSLRYLIHTRSDITYSVGIVSRFMERPTSKHLAAVKHILRYVSGTLNLGIKYHTDGEEKLKLLGFSDSGDVDDRKSTTGVLFYLCSSPISWLTQKQKVVAMSSCEAEYIAGAATACQGIWLGRLLSELIEIPFEQVTLKIDNQSAISMCKNPVFHERSKHIEI
jgi:hypothetical protein